MDFAWTAGPQAVCNVSNASYTTHITIPDKTKHSVSIFQTESLTTIIIRKIKQNGLAMVGMKVHEPSE